MDWEKVVFGNRSAYERNARPDQVAGAELISGTMVQMIAWDATPV